MSSQITTSMPISYITNENRKRMFQRFPKPNEVNDTLKGKTFESAVYGKDGGLKELIFEDGSVMAVTTDYSEIPVIVDSLARYADD